MKDALKKNWSFVAIALISVFLGVLAVLTTIKVRQQQPVAPTAPESKPQAVSGSPLECRTSFTITYPKPSPSPTDLACTSKIAQPDDPRNIPGTYYISSEKNITPNTTITVGDVLVYKLYYKNYGNITAGAGTITDVLPNNVQFMDAEPNCNYNKTTRTITCDLGDVAAQDDSQKFIRVKVNSIPTTDNGEFTNRISVTSTINSTPSTCEVTYTAVALQVTPSPSPSVSPSPSPSPSKSLTPSPSPTPGSGGLRCGDTCTDDTDCPSNLECLIEEDETTGICRNPSCTLDTDCICTPSRSPTPTPNPSPSTAVIPKIPESGTTWPTLLLLLGGISLLILGIAL